MVVFTRLIRLVTMVAAAGITSPPLFCGDEAPEAAKREELHRYLKGRYLYQKNCVTCHGRTGRGDGPWAAELEHKPRNFRTGLFKFRTTPFGMLPVEEDLRRTIRSGISGTAMPIFGHLRDDEIDALVLYLQSLSSEWDREELESEPLSLPETPVWFTDLEKRAERAGRGAGLFATHCAACHGPEGRGDGPGGAALVDSWGNPIRPADLSAEHHKSGDRPSDLYRTIATGFNGTPMVGFAALMEPGEIWDLVAFLEGLSDSARKKESAE